MTLRLTADTAASVARHHDQAARSIDASAARAPGAVDGGIGTGYLMDILAAVSGTASDLAALNGGIAAQVRDAADDLGLTEDQVGTEFTRMSGHVS